MSMTAEPIPLPDAIRVCEAVAARSRARWWHPSSWQCLGCVRFSSDAEHRCFSGPGNRGCPHLNKAWDTERRQTPAS